MVFKLFNKRHKNVIEMFNMHS